MDGSAVVLCDGYYRTPNGKTAHGLVRGTARYRIVGVVDSSSAGNDAGDLLDGKHRGIPIFAGLREALAHLPERPDFAVVGVATSGGRFTPGLRALFLEALGAGLSVVNGLHEFVAEDPELARLARERGVTITDIRKPRPSRDLHFWTGEIGSLRAPRVAVLGTDCALGKRTTTRLLAEACSKTGLRTEWIFTGQTGWLQGAPFGILLDALPNDFVSGELEHAILSCARGLRPDLILIEGQSSLRNPSGPCGSELILSGGARGVILQHAPARPYFEGYEQEELQIPPLSEEITLIRLLGAETLGLALNGEGMSRAELERSRVELEQEQGLPVALPLEEGVSRLVPALQEFVRKETAD